MIETTELLRQQSLHVIREVSQNKYTGIITDSNEVCIHDAFVIAKERFLSIVVNIVTVVYNDAQIPGFYSLLPARRLNALFRDMP